MWWFTDTRHHCDYDMRSLSAFASPICGSSQADVSLCTRNCVQPSRHLTNFEKNCRVSNRQGGGKPFSGQTWWAALFRSANTLLATVNERGVWRRGRFSGKDARLEGIGMRSNGYGLTPGRRDIRLWSSWICCFKFIIYYRVPHVVAELACIR